MTVGALRRHQPLHVVGARAAGPFGLNTFLIRIVHLAVVAVLVGYLGAHHHRFQRELGRLVAWPRRVPRQPDELAAELVSECADVLEAPRVLLMWEEPEEGSIKLAWGSRDPTSRRAPSPKRAYGSFVVSGLEQGTFQTPHASAGHGARDPLVGGIVPAAASAARFIPRCRPASTWSGSSPGASTAS